MSELRKLDKPPYRAPTGNWYTTALFVETSASQGAVNKVIHPVFSLHDDKPGVINAQKTFVELRDPTGYKWAMLYLADFRHWVRLYELPWFKEAVEIWRTNLRMKLQSEALEKIQEIAGSETSQAFAAAKYIAEEGWNQGSGRGRPSKVEVDANLKRLTKEAKIIDDDAERIGLRLIQGGRSGNKS